MPRAVSCCLTLWAVVACGRAEPLDEAAADALLRSEASPADLFCRVDVAVRDGLALSRQGPDGMRRVSECLGALQRRGLVEAHCLAMEDSSTVFRGPCGGLKVTVEEGQARVADGTLEVRCGTTLPRAKTVESAGDVAWISATTSFDVAPDLVEALEPCRPVPAVLPATTTRVGRWRGAAWQLDPG